MSDPYEVLDLKPDAGETEVRQRYLELVRAFPPDRAPERFAAIHAAYASLRDPSERLRMQIFALATKSESFESIVADLQSRLRDVRVPVDILLGWADSP
jgi:curved DNA-binding protein CbpA